MCALSRKKLLTHLDNFKDSLLVTGCQRSGTTAISRLLRQAEGMANFQRGSDDELDGALILAGRVEPGVHGRYCFQTAYLNERYPEYVEHLNHYIIWVLRNPHSVIHSMLCNWKDFALNELFLSCGYAHIDHRDRVRFQRFGLRGIERLDRAIYAYLGKTMQLFWLKAHYPTERLAVIDYDQLILDKSRIVTRLFDFAAVPFRESYLDMLLSGSLKKKDGLENSVRQRIERCSAIYERALSEITIR